MAKLFLGTREVTPTIYDHKAGYSEIPAYKVTNGVASRRGGALTGNEFSDITSIDEQAMWYLCYRDAGLTGTVNFSSLTSIGKNGLTYAFNYCTGITGVNLPSLTTVGEGGLSETFAFCSSLTGALDLSLLTNIPRSGLNRAFIGTGLTSVNLSSLATVGVQGLYYAFGSCFSLTSVNLSSLVSVDYNALSYAFYHCEGLTSISFPSLNSIGDSGLSSAFQYCTGLTDIYFNALKTTSFGNYTSQFNNMMSYTGKKKNHTLHFPSNLSSTITGLTGYPNFGGTSGYVTLAFDLPATS